MKKPTILFLVLLIAFSPVSFPGLLVMSQASDDPEEINGYQEWTQDRVIDDFLVVNSGATLVIKNGVTVSFNGGTMHIDGTVIASGTKKNPVIFKKDSVSTRSFSINVNASGKLIMRNVDVSGSGFGFNTVQNNNFVNAAIASATGGINVGGGWLNAQGCNFHDNNIPINIENANPGRVKVNRSKFVDNDNMDVYYYGSSGKSFDFKYNWWGSSDGPSKYCYSPGDCYYDKFNDEVNFSSWLTAEDFHDPVIIIPGILGSQKKNGKWQMDPVAHTYDNLYQEFAGNGYVPEKDLFEFPYEWRDSNVENAKLLKVKIQEIKEKNNWPKVDVVAHSMGGLLAREYIESDYYQDDIDQLITLGTPHNGAPEAYLKWDGNGWFWSARDLYLKHTIGQEAKEKGYDDIFDYVHQRPITSLQELLPVYNYLQDVSNNYAFRDYSDDYPRNDFLERINNDENKSKLNNVEFDKIIGKLDVDTSTISGFKVIDADMGKYWIHGYPLGFEILVGDRGLIKSDGDRTVPLESAESANIPADEVMHLKKDHGSLPTEAQKDVLELLTGERPEGENRDSLIKDMFFASVYSPIDIQIIAPDGKRMGKNFVTGGEYSEIPGAYYSGYDTDSEFLTIPNPEDGEYKILTQGTGNGEYKVEVAKISEDENNLGVGSTAVISGTATTGSQEELKVEIAGDEVTTGEQDKIPPTVKITSPENKTYRNNKILEIKYDISDDVSPADKIKIEMFFDGQVINNNKVDLSLEHLGAHTILVKATDEAGNIGEDKIEFTNDADINSIISNVNHYFSLRLITNIVTRNYLRSKLQIIKGEIQVVDELKKAKLPKFAKDKLLGTFKKIVNQEISHVIRQIQKERNLVKTIDPKVRELLVESLESIKL